MALIPLRQAAREFHVDRTTLHRHIRAGRLKAFRRPMDRRTYVDRDELHELLTFRPVAQPATAASKAERLRAALAGFAQVRSQMRPVDAVAIARAARRELEERGAY